MLAKELSTKKQRKRNHKPNNSYCLRCKNHLKAKVGTELVVLIILLLLGAYPAFCQDIQPPEATQYDPDPGDNLVWPDTNIMIKFEDASGVDEGLLLMKVKDQYVAPSIDCSGNPISCTMTYDPPEDFALGEVVSVWCLAYDRAALPNRTEISYSFTIRTSTEDNEPPEAKELDPKDGAKDVPPSTNIKIVLWDYSQVDETTLTMSVGGADVTSDVVTTCADKECTMIYNPGQDFTFGQTVNVGYHACDLKGTPNCGDGSFSFTIIEPEDTTPPDVIARNPEADQTDVPPGTNIYIKFDDPGSGVDDKTLTMTVNGAAVTPEIGCEGTACFMNYYPPQNFNIGDVVSVVAHACDKASTPNCTNPDEEAYSFTIGSREDHDKPFIVVQDPIDGANNVPPSTNIYMSFDDATTGVDVDTLRMQINTADVVIVKGCEGSACWMLYDPTEDFVSGPVTVGYYACDLATPLNYLLGSFTFTVGADADPPAKVEQIPEADATNVPVNTDIYMRFNDPSGISTFDFEMLVNGVEVNLKTGCVQSDPTNCWMRYEPAEDFGFNQVISVEYKACDVLDNCLDQSFSFTTEAPPEDHDPPVFSNRDPRDQERGVDPSTKVVLDVTDVASGIYEDSVTMEINGTLVDITLGPIISGYHVEHTPQTPFELNSEVSVSVIACDQATPANCATDEYSFFTSECVFGDIDLDFLITPNDALQALKMYLGLYDRDGDGLPDEPNETELCAALVTNGCEVTPDDALCILMMYVGVPCPGDTQPPVASDHNPAKNGCTLPGNTISVAISDNCKLSLEKEKAAFDIRVTKNGSNVEGSLTPEYLTECSLLLTFTAAEGQDWKVGEKVNVTITGADASGNLLQDSPYYFDVESGSTPPVIFDRDPHHNQTGVPRDVVVKFKVSDCLEGVNINSAKVWLSGFLYTPNDPGFSYQPLEDVNGYEVFIDPAEYYGGEIIEVKIQIWDLANNLIEDIYSFTIENVIYVDDDNAGDPDMNGTIGHPYDTIGKAFAASAAYDTIIVFEGNYSDNLIADVPLEVIGAGADITFVDGKNTGNVFTFTGSATGSSLSGFSVFNGYYGVQCMTTNADLYEIDCYNNSQGGISISEPSQTGKDEKDQIINLRNCRIHNNNGAGIWLFSAFEGKQRIIDSCVIFDNNGSGINNSKTVMSVHNCVITNNTSGIRNFNSSDSDLRNNIIVLNGPEPNDPGYGIFCQNSTAAVEYNDVWGNKIDYAGCPGGIGCIWKDPKFIGAPNYHLDSGSPCIDAGDLNSLYNDPCDENNQALPPAQGSCRNDMGAYGGPYAREGSVP